MLNISEGSARKVFEYFQTLCSVPHGSGNTKQISDICVAFAREHGLKYRQDEYNNVVIVKEASAGYENAPTVILQGHMDMVCAADEGCGIDMSRDGLRLLVDGDWLTADGTSLGGDDCIAVALVMALLDDDSLLHPRIEAVFTTDEETGMDGAIGLDMSDLKGRVLVNLDSEEENVITISCAGGVKVNCLIPAKAQALPDGYVYRRVEISGLKGGHSGVEIHKGRANAIKLMGRMLHKASLDVELRLCDISGGTLSNVIPLFCSALVAIPKGQSAAFEDMVSEFNGIYKAEYSAADPKISVSCTPADGNGKAFSLPDTGRMLFMLLDAPYGVEEMSMDFPNLVQTSSNPGVVAMTESGLELVISVRSSKGTQKTMLAQRVVALCKMLGGKPELSGDYSGWEYRPNSPLREHIAIASQNIMGEKPEITATHGGLECGLFIEKIPDLDCVSLGPKLLEIHSSRERLSISSTERLYKIMISFLEGWR